MGACGCISHLHGVALHCVRGVVTGRFWGFRGTANAPSFVKGGKKHETGVSWRKIKAEYIAGGISQRKLAEKYGVNRNLLMRMAQKEKWKAKRDRAEAKALEKVEQKTAEAVADNAVTLQRIKAKLLTKLEGMVDNFPTGNAQEIKIKDKGLETIYRMRDIAAVYVALEDKTAKGQTADMEDLTPLVVLLNE